MDKKTKKILFLTICFVMILSKINIFAYANNRTIKVGLCLYEPYYYKDKNNNITGYYHDLLEILCKDANMKYEYVNVRMDNAVEKLKNNEIDILLGVHYREDRAKKLYYSVNNISLNNQSLYTKDQSVAYGDVNYLNGKRLAYIKGDIAANWINNAFKVKNIKLDLVEAKSLDECVDMIETDRADVTSLPSGNSVNNNYNNIFNYSSGIVYIAGNENSKDIVKKFDEIINEKYKSKYYNKLLSSYNKYFRKEIIEINLISLFCVILLVLIILYKVIYPVIKKITLRRKIRENKEKNNFTLYYQPIVNPNNNEVVGFESLLRLKDKNNKILLPSCFLKDIETAGMFFEMTLWVLERAIHDYKIISNYKCYKNKNFYISINLSFEELENEDFINRIIKIADKNKINKGSICLEILESTHIKDLEGIKSTIEILKNNGFKIAIDDFGIEYANLNMLEIVAFDIIKLDKYFADNISKSKINNEVIKFLSNITLLTNKYFIIEGVEETYQIDEIKNIHHNNLYIQGYFYSKPLPLKELEKFTVKL